VGRQFIPLAQQSARTVARAAQAKRIAAYRAFNYLFTPLPHAGPKVRKDAMANTVSLSDVLADYINRYGLSEKARQYFLERVQRDGSLETCESVNERLEGTA